MMMVLVSDSDLYQTMKSISEFDLTHTLARFPYIVENLNTMWGDVEILNYLNPLLLTDREDREGLPLNVALELLEVKNYYRLIVDNLKTEETKVNEILQRQSSQFR